MHLFLIKRRQSVELRSRPRQCFHRTFDFFSFLHRCADLWIHCFLRCVGFGGNGRAISQLKKSLIAPGHFFSPRSHIIIHRLIHEAAPSLCHAAGAAGAAGVSEAQRRPLHESSLG